MTASRKDIAQEERKANATPEKAFVAATDAGKVPRMADMLYLIIQEIGLPEIAKIVAEQIRTGSPKTKAEFAGKVFDAMKAHEKMAGELTEDEVSKLTEDMIDTILKNEYGLDRGAAAKS